MANELLQLPPLTKEYRTYQGFKVHTTDSKNSRRTRGSWRLIVVPTALSMGLLLAACGSSSTTTSAATTTSVVAAHKGGGKNAAKLTKGKTVTVKTVTADQLTVTTKAGKSKTVLMDSTTTVTQNGARSSISAVKANDTILVKGTRNSSGDIVARSIVIQP